MQKEWRTSYLNALRFEIELNATFPEYGISAQATSPDVLAALRHQIQSLISEVTNSGLDPASIDGIVALLRSAIDIVDRPPDAGTVGEVQVLLGRAGSMARRQGTTSRFGRRRWP